MIRRAYYIEGVVQGVGFRPFIYKLASELNLVGFVKNSVDGVELEIEGFDASVAEFEDLLFSRLPPLAKIMTMKSSQLELHHDKNFKILQSSSDKESSKKALISPDIAICSECLEDVMSRDRYRGYFATNCTNCGPRYSIIKRVPYDRVNTSMKKFNMCPSCKEEYMNPLSRRYHAQPISCSSCGPTLSATIIETAEHIKNAKIVAIKGIGGFHIICDSANKMVVERLRQFKNRATKPFAIMCKNIEQIESIASISKEERELLESKEAPIVIVKKLKYDNFIAPNMDRVGCFLPYTPLHHLLFRYLKNPIIATSANLASEPIITRAEDISKKLPFIDFVLDFDRDIINGVDDSLMQIVAGEAQVLRMSRGFAPKVIRVPFRSEKRVLAVGANAKNAIALLIDDNIIISPHIGDLDSLRAFDSFQATIETFKRFYDFEADVILHDKHPNYLTTKWAKGQDRELIAIGHHLAHIYACKAEFSLSGEHLGFSFDGTGYGDDKTLWGGEIFVGDRREYSFKQIKLIGGERAIKEPRRVALSMLFDRYTLDEVLSFDLELLSSFKIEEIRLLHQSYIKNINAPLSSSVGRLFDAMASFSSLLQFQSFEGEAGLICEQHYNAAISRTFEYKIINGIIDIEFDFFHKDLISIFINTLVKIVVDISKSKNISVVLSGGVFQNRTLLELIIEEFGKESIKYYHQQETAINDGGIALGQIYYYLTQVQSSVCEKTEPTFFI